MSKIRRTQVLLSAGSAFAAFVLCCTGRGDQVNMQNGERYVGRVVTFSNEVVVVQSDVVGTLLVPRSKIASIILGTNAVAKPVDLPAVATAPATRPSVAASNPNPDLAVAVRQLRANTNTIQQVQQQLLSGADPEAKEMFNQMVGGLMNGSLNVNDIRAQAKSAADQLRSAKKEFGDEAGFAIDGYLAVLDGFLRETATTTGTTTNAPASLKPKRTQSSEDE